MPIIQQKNQNINLVKIQAIDAGNRHIKWLDRKNNPRRIPSYSLQLEDFQDTPKGNDESVVIEFEGDRFVLGKIAKTMKGVPTYQTEKTDPNLAKLLIMAAMEPVQGSVLPLHIEQLRICLPDSRNREQVNNLKSLTGTKTIIRNGVEITYSIAAIEVWDECKGSYLYGKKANLYNYPNHVNGVLDIGGGTILAKLFSPDGEFIRGGDVRLDGTFELARAIASHLLPKLNYSPELPTIMDAIADKSLTLGATGISFKQEFGACKTKWVESVRARLKEAWQPYRSDIGEVLICGGSAPLFQSLEVSSSGRFKILPNHQFAGIHGMALGGD
jgi:hypothetical protein